METVTELGNLRQAIADAKGMAGVARQRATDRVPAGPGAAEAVLVCEVL
jgi:hypothetical protein